MNSRIIPGALLAALAGMGGGTPMPSPGARRVFRNEPPPDPGPLRVACPKCGAVAGQPCRRATLGRYRYHLARVLAAGGEP